MAKPRPKVYSATRVIDAPTFLNSEAQEGLQSILTALDEMMTEVAQQMTRDGVRPDPSEVPILTFEFQAKGAQNVRQDREGD